MSDSDDSRSGDKKRGREGEEDIFRKSKKVMRTPKKFTKREEEEKEEMKEMLKMVLSEVKEIRKENREHKEQLEKLQNEVMELKVEAKETKQKMELMENKLERYEKDKKRNNIVIKGLKIDGNNNKTLKEDMENFIRLNLEVNTKLKSAHKINVDMEPKEGHTDTNRQWIKRQ